MHISKNKLCGTAADLATDDFFRLKKETYNNSNQNNNKSSI